MTGLLYEFTNSLSKIKFSLYKISPLKKIKLCYNCNILGKGCQLNKNKTFYMIKFEEAISTNFLRETLSASSVAFIFSSVEIFMCLAKSL